MNVDPEKAPLLSPSIGVPVATKEPRQFKGRWWHVLGDFGPADVSATCLAWNAPWVAYGWNTQRGLGLSWWKEALKLMLLTCGVFALVRLLLVLLVETQCPGVPHGPHPPMHHHRHGGPWGHVMHPRHADGGPLPIPADATKPFDPSAKATATAAATTDASTQTSAAQDPTKPLPDHGPHRADHPDHDDDDDHHDHDHHKHHKEHEHHEHHEHGGFWADLFDHHHRHEEEKHRDVADKALATSATNTADAATSTSDDIIDADGARDFDDDADEDEDDDDFDFDKLTPEQREALQRCAVRVGPWAVLLFSVALSAALYATYLAALRRRMMRERFGIDGSFKHDLLLWGCCAPCALAQETRTLMFNNVEEGLWHGPLQQVVVAAAAPHQVQPMAA